MKSKVLFLGCNHNELPYLKSLQDRGFHVVATDKNPTAPGMTIADSTIVCAYDDLPGLENAIKIENNNDFQAVFTASAQFAHLGAAHISQKLGLNYPPVESISACLNKRAFYPIFEKSGIPIPDTHYIKSLSALEKVLTGYSRDTNFYLKSDYSKNPDHIYTGQADALLRERIQWIPDRYFREYYILQTRFDGRGVRLNLFPDGYELYDFDTAMPIAVGELPQLFQYNILDVLRGLSADLGMEGWLLKFDLIFGENGYVVLDIGMDPPSRMKRYWEASGRNFVDFYLDLYLGA